MSPRAGAVALFSAVLAFAPAASAQEPVTPDRVAVRFIAPETGGAARPQFFTERQVGFFARMEALIESVPMEGDAYPERYVRNATDRLVARAMLSALLVSSGTEPPDLPKRALDLRAELADRIGGPAVLDDALQREGLEEPELMDFLNAEVRASWYVDKTIQPIYAVSEDALREAYRANVHPYRTMKYEDVRVRLRRWLAVERLRAAELEYLQSARARIRIVSVGVK